MIPWIIAGLVLVAAIVGYAIGAIATSLGAGRMAHAYAEWLAEHDRESTDAALENEDEQSRLDGLTIRDLLAALEPVLDNEDAAKTFQLGEYTLLADRFMAVRDRFADWIEWAEQATATKNAFSAPEPDGAVL